MRSRRKPFQQGKITPTPVTQTETGFVWLGAKGFISPNTNPIELQDKQKKQAQVSLLILEAAEALAKARGIQSSDARKLFFPQDVKKASGSDAQVEVKAEEIFDWLNMDQKTLYFSLTQDAADIPVKVATMMMQYRLLYQVDITESAKVKTKALSIAEPWFDLQPGDRLSVMSEPSPILVKIASPYDPETGSIDVESLIAEIPAGSVGFLLEGSSYAIGDPSWTESDTLSLSLECADKSTSQIEAINQFYLRECGRLSEALEGEDQDDSADEGNGQGEVNAIAETQAETQTETSDKPLEITLVPQALTGVKSIGASNLTELTTIDSRTQILETAPTG